MKSIKLLSIALLVLIFVKCATKTNRVDDIVIKKIEKCTEVDPCIIDFSNQFDFDWEEMYYFSGALSLEEIQNLLKMSLDKYTDVGDRVIFINKGQIVFEEEWFVNSSDGNKNNTVIFDINENYHKFRKEDSQFSIVKKDNILVLTPFTK
jgi:hypothetical protein